MEESRGMHLGVIRSVLAILQWWGFNVTVIIINKWIFQKLDFKFPLSVSCIHFICSAIGAYIAIKVLRIKPLIEVDPEDRWRRIFPMSFVFCINIVLGNVSLRYIPVSFMQTIKSFTPATTVILQWVVWRKQFDGRIWASLVPIVGGILLTSITELSFNIFGFCAALFGCLATSTKTILAESLLHGFKFDSINTVYYMAPFATMILAVPAVLLEGVGVINWFYTHEAVYSALIIIISSGVLAFCLNFSIFYVIHSTNAVTFNVAGNLKISSDVTVLLRVTHSNMKSFSADVRFSLDMSIESVKEKLWKKCGTSVDSMTLELYDDAGAKVCDLNDNLRPLGFYSPQNGYRFHIIDLDPSSITSGGWLEDTSLVEKYKISDDAYDKLDCNFRKFKDKLISQNPTANESKLPDNYMEDLCTKIKVGDRCEVEPGEKRGVVKFVGRAENIAPGFWVGIQFDEPLGKHNGLVRGKRYFDCPTQHGALVRPDKVKVGDYPERDPFDDDEEI